MNRRPLLQQKSFVVDFGQVVAAFAILSLKMYVRSTINTHVSGSAFIPACVSDNLVLYKKVTWSDLISDSWHIFMGLLASKYHLMVVVPFRIMLCNTILIIRLKFCISQFLIIWNKSARRGDNCTPGDIYEYFLPKCPIHKLIMIICEAIISNTAFSVH